MQKLHLLTPKEPLSLYHRGLAWMDQGDQWQSLKRMCEEIWVPAQYRHSCKVRSMRSGKMRCGQTNCFMFQSATSLNLWLPTPSMVAISWEYVHGERAAGSTSQAPGLMEIWPFASFTESLPGSTDCKLKLSFVRLLIGFRVIHGPLIKTLETCVSSVHTNSHTRCNSPKAANGVIQCTTAELMIWPTWT